MRGAAKRKARRTAGTPKNSARRNLRERRHARHAAPTDARRGASLLVSPGLLELRRPGGTDRAHASRTGRREALDLGATFPARAQLLHGAAGPGGAATGHLHRLADAPDVGRHRRRRPVRAAVAVRAHRAVVALHGVRQRAGGRGRALRRQARCRRDRPARCMAHRLADAAASGPVGDRRRRVGRDRAFSVPFPAIVLAAGLVGLRRRARRAVGVRDEIGARRRRWSASAVDHRRRHADARACALRLAAPSRRARRVRGAMGIGARCAGRGVRAGIAARADGMVLLERPRC